MNIPFSSIDNDAVASIKRLRAADPSELSEYSLAYMRHWNNPIYRVEFAIVAGCGIFRVTFNHRTFYSLPFGPGDRDSALQALPRSRTLGLLTSEAAALAQARGALVFPSGDGPDYVYRQADLATLKGSHYQAKRNFCHRFEAAGPWEYGPLRESDALAVLALWEREHALDEEARAEVAAIRADLKEVQLGGVLYQQGRPVAFAMGERLTPEMLLVSYEKAVPGVVGAYQMINREFARREGAGCQWLNRASADGHPNLVKAKESYFPVRRLEKFLAFEPGFTDGASLRLATPQDEPRIVALWQQVFGDGPEFIHGILRESTTFVVQNAQEIVAMGHVLDRDGVKYLYAVATAPASRGRGYATAIVHAAKDFFMADTLALVPGNPELVPWYERQGFTVTSVGHHITMATAPLEGFQITDPMM